MTHTSLIVFSPEGIFQEADDAFLQWVGYSRAELIGQHHRLLVRAAEANAPEYAEFWRRIGEGHFVSGIFERIAKNGGTLLLAGSYNPVYGPTGTLVKVVKAVTPVERQSAGLVQRYEQAAVQRNMRRVNDLVLNTLNGLQLLLAKLSEGETITTADVAMFEHLIHYTAGQLQHIANGTEKKE